MTLAASPCLLAALAFACAESASLVFAFWLFVAAIASTILGPLAFFVYSSFRSAVSGQASGHYSRVALTWFLVGLLTIAMLVGAALVVS